MRGRCSWAWRRPTKATSRQGKGTDHSHNRRPIHRGDPAHAHWCRRLGQQISPCGASRRTRLARLRPRRPLRRSVAARRCESCTTPSMRCSRKRRPSSTATCWSATMDPLYHLGPLWTTLDRPSSAPARTTPFSLCPAPLPSPSQTYLIAPIASCPPFSRVPRAAPRDTARRAAAALPSQCIQENADLLTEEGQLLAKVQGEDVVDYDIDACVQTCPPSDLARRFGRTNRSRGIRSLDPSLDPGTRTG